MSEIVIDESLNKHLGLPVDYQIDKVEAFKIYMYFQGMLETKHPINTHLMMMYYIDFNGGNFLLDVPKNRRDSVVRDIVENMPMPVRFEVMTYASGQPEPFDNEK